MMRLDAEYVLPLRWTDDADLAELTAYLTTLADHIDVTVVDGSPPLRYAAHTRAWPSAVRQVPPGSPYGLPVGGGNGKARGVVTGLALARHERVVIADDDVRHDAATLSALLAELEHADLVCPQNVFGPQPWHARWDTARSLVNRAFGSDYPGTYALHVAALPRGYDIDTLFENLEMERTVRARGGRVRRCPDLFVVRTPSSVRRFREQRVRQAYDSLAQPLRLCAEIAIAPTVLTLRHRPLALGLLAAGAVAVAEIGRRRGHGRAVFGRTAALWAPAWVLERALTSWIALALRARGGVTYAGRRMRRAATPVRVLRERAASSTIGTLGDA